MIKINVYYIAKHSKDLSDKLCEEFSALCLGFGVKLDFVNLFSKTIKEHQRQEAQMAQRSYTKEFQKIGKEQYRIALAPSAQMLDSIGFAELLRNRGRIAFFIGGAYGLEPSFMERCDQQISFSALTFSHKVAKVVLSEQIYRAFCLLNNHPYHK